MAAPLTPAKLLAVLRAEGLRVAEYPGWKTNERDDETGKAFGPVHMILNHHTAGTSSLNVVAKGRAGLPGPLAHAHLNKAGLLTLVSAGRANHAGLMAENAFNSFLNEDSAHPAPSASSGTLDGNDLSYGIEVENLGDMKDPYTVAQYDAMVRFNAALCREYGWSADSVGCHRETSVEGKVDPRGPVEGYGTRRHFDFTPGILRVDVAERLRHPASWSPDDGKETPVAQAPQSNETYDAVARADAIPAPRNHPDVTGGQNVYWTMETYLRFIAEELIRQRS